MKVLVVANHKGGVGKTIISIHLAYFFLEKGYDVKFIDLDPQGDSSCILSEDKRFECILNSSDLFNITDSNFKNGSVLFKGNTELAKFQNVNSNIFKENILNLAQQKNNSKSICIIDTAPTASEIQITPLIPADFVISPIELDEFSFRGISTIVNTISNVRKTYNSKLNFLGIIPNRVHGTSPRQIKLLKELQEKYSHLLVSSDCSIGERQAVKDAISNRQPVWKLKGSRSKAKAELLEFATLVYNKVTK